MNSFQGVARAQLTPLRYGRKGFKGDIPPDRGLWPGFELVPRGDELESSQTPYLESGEHKTAD